MAILANGGEEIKKGGVQWYNEENCDFGHIFTPLLPPPALRGEGRVGTGGGGEKWKT